MSTPHSERQWRVAQLGARMHYAVPRILRQAGQLQMLYTDLCSRKGIARLTRLIPAALRSNGVSRLLGRDAAGISVDKICSFDRLGLDYERRRRRANNDKELVAAFLWCGRRFCELILQQGIEGCSGIYVFNTAGLELLSEARRRGLLGVVEQTIAPKRIELELLAQQREMYIDWENEAPPSHPGIAELIAREAAEWSAASTIVCGSEFVKAGIEKCGGPVSKCIVIPYGAELRGRSEGEHRRSQPRPKRRLRVLTVGGVELRKGSPDVLEVARQLRGIADFRMVGAIKVTDTKVRELQQVAELTGAVPRTEIRQHFEWADVFFLPSVCEGSATVTYEAFNAGLPVICTPNTGSVVEDGVSGYLVAVGDSESMADRIRRLSVDDELLITLSEGARRRAKECTVTAYGERLLMALNSLPLPATESSRE
jgi:glycosyltransferase involved in cell wall biosynthesis